MPTSRKPPVSRLFRWSASCGALALVGIFWPFGASAWTRWGSLAAIGLALLIASVGVVLSARNRLEDDVLEPSGRQDPSPPEPPSSPWDDP